jgi:hypothetical protein
VIDLGWLSDRLVEVLKWQLAHPGAKDDPDAPEVPMAGRRVWSIFLQLNAMRSCGMGPNPISGVEIESFARLRREPVRPFELTMLRALDAAYMESARAGQQEGTAAPAAAVNSRSMTPALFDAVFGGIAPPAAPKPPPSGEAVMAVFRRAGAPQKGL